MSEIKREAEAEERLDGLFDDAFRANDEPMLDYVRLKFELKALRQERDTLARRVVEMERDIKEVLARAWAFDDKPHLLFSGVAALAKKHIEEPEYGREIVRLMDDAYENIHGWRQSAPRIAD